MANITLERAGVRKGARVMSFIMQWWFLHHELGREPERVEEYAEFWEVSPATAYREQQAFRETWPEFRTPSGLAAVLGLDLVEGAAPGALAALLSWGDDGQGVRV